MRNLLVAKLRYFGDLTDKDERVLDSLCQDVRDVRAKTDLIEEGDRPEVVFLLVEGWACRYKILPNGGRQIMAYLLPGDLCDAHIFILKEMDHSIGLITDARVASIPKHRILEITDHRPALARALWWATLVDEGVLREWIVNIGRRDAYERVSHLIVELWLRLRMIGLTTDSAFDLPLTQTDWAIRWA